MTNREITISQHVGRDLEKVRAATKKTHGKDYAGVREKTLRNGITTYRGLRYINKGPTLPVHMKIF